MMRVLQAVGTLLILCGIVLLSHTANHWGRPDPEFDRMLALPGALERLTREPANEPARTEGTAPLVAQALLLASYLNPPVAVAPKVERPAVPQGHSVPVPPPVPVRPAAPPTQFRVSATSCYPSQPERSMALIRESQSRRRVARWVKEGSQFGHFTVHEIRRGSIICRSGDQLVEMPVQSRTASRTLVRSHVTGSLQADSSRPNDLLDVDDDSIAR